MKDRQENKYRRTDRKFNFIDRKIDAKNRLDGHTERYMELDRYVHS